MEESNALEELRSSRHQPLNMLSSTPYWTTTPTGNASADTSKQVIQYVAILIAIFGTITNIISLSYFVAKLKSTKQTRNTEAHTKLFLALNISDLLVSVSSALRILFEFFYVPFLFDTFAAIRRISVYATGFLTCLLAVVRAIHMFLPLKVINWSAIYVSITVYGMIISALQAFYIRMLTGEPGYPYFLYDLFNQAGAPTPALLIVFRVVFHIEFLIIASLFVIIVLANVINMGKLYLSQLKTETWKKKATVTVGIISVIYCLCNIGFVIQFIMPCYSLTSYFAIPDEVIEVSNHILLPLNSACNPVVYFYRKKDMKAHIKDLWGKFIALSLCKKEKDNNTVESCSFKSRSGVKSLTSR